MIFAALWLCWFHADMPVTELHNPLLIVLLCTTLLFPVVLGNLRPHRCGAHRAGQRRR